MAGRRFRRERKLYQLNFEGTDLDGLEVIMKGVSLERFIAFSRVAAELESADGRTIENIEAQFQFLAEALVSWNLDDEDGDPVPATYEGLKEQDISDVNAIMVGYMQAISSVPKALNSDSPSGGISEEQSLGLASLSSVRAS